MLSLSSRGSISRNYGVLGLGGSLESELLLVLSNIEAWKMPFLRLSCDEPGSRRRISALID